MSSKIGCLMKILYSVKDRVLYSIKRWKSYGVLKIYPNASYSVMGKDVKITSVSQDKFSIEYVMNGDKYNCLFDYDIFRNLEDAERKINHLIEERLKEIEREKKRLLEYQRKLQK